MTFSYFITVAAFFYFEILYTYIDSIERDFEQLISDMNNVD